MAVNRNIDMVKFGVTAFAAASLLFAPRSRVTPATLPGRAQPGAARRPGAAPGRSPAARDGWWAITKRVGAEINDNRLMTEAAGITFYVLLSLFPALAALISLYGLFFDPKSIAGHLDAISGVVPGGGMDIINDQVGRLTANPASALGFGAVIGLATSLWTSNQAIKALFDSLNTVFHEQEKRSFVWRTILTLSFTLGSLLFVILAIATVIALPVALNFVGLGGVTEVLLKLARWPVLLAGLGLFLAFVYRYGPSRKRASWRWISWGSGLAAIGWVVVSIAFSYYVSNFGSYNKTYGSLGAVVGFMTWIWISATVVLIGAQIDAEMEGHTRQTTRRTPLRQRGQSTAAARRLSCMDRRGDCLIANQPASIVVASDVEHARRHSTA